MFAVSGTPGMLYGTAGVHGLSKSVRSPSADSLIVEHSKRNNIGSSFAWYSTLKSVSGSLGKGAAGILLTLTASDYFLVFILAGLISATSLVVVSRFVREMRSPDPPSRDTNGTPEPIYAKPAGSGKPNRSRFFVTLLPFIGFGCFMSGIGHMVDALFPILAVEYAGMSEAEVGVVYMATTAAVLLAGPVWGWLSDHLSRRMVLIAAGIGNALASAIFLVFPNALGMATGRLVDDVGKSALRPAWGTLMGQLISLNPTRRGQVVGYMGMGKDAGEMAGPIMASLIWAVWGIPVLLGARIALAIGSGIYSMVLLGYIRKLEAENKMDPEIRGNLDASRAGRQVQEGGPPPSR
jgi:MFS family permease